MIFFIKHILQVGFPLFNAKVQIENIGKLIKEEEYTIEWDNKCKNL